MCLHIGVDSKMRLKRNFAVLSLLLWMISPSMAQKRINVDRAQIDDIVIKLRDSLKIPGIAVGIAVGDEIKYVNVFGSANLETKTPVNINSVWQLCSVSKQFSTVACLKLAGENKLSLQDKISRYVDGLPENYSEISIFHLLSQTSGIKDYLNDKGLYGVPWESVKEKVFSDTLNFRPGDAWRYSNTGFWLAAKILEKVTGMEYDRYLTQTFFDELQMTHTQRISAEQVIESRVNGYEYREGKFYNRIEDMHKFRGQGDGDLISTLNDLLKWNIALTQGKVVKKEMLAALWTPTKLNNGKELEIAPNSGINYGLGWFIKTIDGKKIVWTPGAGFGFSTSSQFIPEYNMSIVVFCNKNEFLMADEIGFSIFRNIAHKN